MNKKRQKEELYGLLGLYGFFILILAAINIWYSAWSQMPNTFIGMAIVADAFTFISFCILLKEWEDPKFDVVRRWFFAFWILAIGLVAGYRVSKNEGKMFQDDVDKAKQETGVNQHTQDSLVNSLATLMDSAFSQMDSNGIVHKIILKNGHRYIHCNADRTIGYYNPNDSKWLQDSLNKVYPNKNKHVHVFDVWEKCNYPGCGGWCKCTAFKEYTTGKIFPSKDSAFKYLKRYYKDTTIVNGGKPYEILLVNDYYESI